MPYSRLFYHLVWATKERLPLINANNREPIYASIHAKAGQLKGIVHALSGTADHVHLVVTVPPNLPLALFIGQVKGNSSHLASRLGTTDGAFAWQSEYGVVSVSEAHLSIVVRYVQRQEHHHAEKTLNATLENCG
jgi:putative transposase